MDNYRESIEITKLKNRIGKVWYTVLLLTFRTGFVVKVKDFVHFRIPFDVIRTEFSTYDAAKDAYLKLTDDYSLLMRSEDKPKISIKDIFGDAIGYKVIDPDCCGNCKFARWLLKESKSKFKPCKNVLECHHAGNIIQLERLNNSPETPRTRDHIELGIRVSPEVEPRGICKNYVRDGIGQHVSEEIGCLDYDRDVIELVDSMIDAKLNDISESEIIVDCGGAEE